MRIAPRVLCILLMILLAASVSFGQSIIVKLRPGVSSASPSARLQALTKHYLSAPLTQAPIFYAPKGKGQTPQTTSTFGFERIVITEVAGGHNASEVARLFADLPEVEWAQPNYLYHIDAAAEQPNDSLFADQWAHQILEVQRAWQITKGDTSVKIGFIDTGVDWFHPDLVGQFAVNRVEDINGNGLFDAWLSGVKQVDDRGTLVTGDLDGIDNDGNGFADDVIGYDFVDQRFVNFGDAADRDPIPRDEHEFSHGTAVAGVIGAKENNRIGVAGIAPGCRMVALRAFDATGNAEDDDIASAIIYAAENGVRILNLSFGDIWPSLLQRDAIRYAESKGCLVFASSGNRGGSGRHYPSDFDECVSVGATTSNDGLWFGTVTGEGMDILAPGNNILTTDRNTSYQYISGTSFSAPTAAAVAGLVLSNRPELSPRELRSILESTTDDLFPFGYDHTHANGRVNARAAIEYQGSASIKITSPSTNDGFWVDEEIEVLGSAVSTLFTDYTLSFAKGLNPDIDTNDESLWTIIKQSDGQVVQGSLGIWNAAGLTAGTYTLRLAVRSSDGRSTEERITIELKAKAPAIVAASIDTVFIEEKTGLLAQIEGDTLTYATLHYRLQGAAVWQSKNDDRYSRRHAILLTSEEAKANTLYELLLVLRNSSGDTSSQAFIAAMPDIAVNQRGFRQKTYALPLGFLLDTVVSTPAGKTVIESVFPPGSDFGRVYSYTFDSLQKNFRKTDSTKASWVPRELGSIDGNARDLLLQGSTRLVVHRATEARPIFGNIIRQDTLGRNDITALGYADPDGDGIDDIVAIHQVIRGQRLVDVIELRSASDDNFPIIAELPNTTSPDPLYRDNKYQKPGSRAKDLNGDGKEEIVILDDDADLLVFTRDDAGLFRMVSVDSNAGSTEGTMVTIGDLDGDGKQDIVYAFHTSFDENVLGEYDPKYWTVKTLLGNGDGTFRQTPPIYFWNARSDKLYRSSLSAIKNVTGSGADELELSLFPDFYLFKFDAAQQQLAPIWHYPVSITPRCGFAHDLDANGMPEIAIGGGDSIYFFEREYLLAGRTLPPGGLEAIPRDTDRVDLKWGNVPGATLYYILRAIDGDNTFAIIDSTTALIHTDTTVKNQTLYIYSVVAVDPTREEPESQSALAVEAFVHPKPVITHITTRRDFVKLHASQPLREDALEGAGFYIDGVPCLTATVASDSSVIIRSASSLSLVDSQEVAIRTERLRDVWNSPVDTGFAGRFLQTSDDPSRRFYVVRWHFEGNDRMVVEFNSRPGDNALDISHYTLSPYGTLVKASRDGNPNRILIDLANTQIVALGVPFVLCVTGITDDVGTPIEESEGNCIGVTTIEPSLANIFVYPNPVRSTDGKAVFARLTPEAEVSIYTVSHRFLRTLRSTDRTGGVEWDLRDDAGNELPSGVYIYHVTGKDENGNEVEPNKASFVMIRNN